MKIGPPNVVIFAHIGTLDSEGFVEFAVLFYHFSTKGVIMPDRKGTRVKEKIEKGVPYNRLKGMIKGESLQPGDVGYEKARKLWNGMVDKRPAFIARVLDEEDISTVVTFAQEYNVIVAV